MNAPQNSIRSPLAKAKGMGTAKTGTEDWMIERLTAAAIVPVAFYVLVGFLNHVVAGGYSGTMYWLQSPYATTAIIFLLLASLRHAAAGLRVVLEDYISCKAMQMTLIFSVNFLFSAMAIVGTLSATRIFFGV